MNHSLDFLICIAFVAAGIIYLLRRGSRSKTCCGTCGTKKVKGKN